MCFTDGGSTQKEQAMQSKKFRREILSKVKGAKLTHDGVMIGDSEFQFFITDHEKFDPDLTESERFFTPFCSKSEIIRLREIGGAHDYLLRMRAEAIVDSPRQVRVFRKRKKKFTRSGKHWNLTGFYNSINAPARRYVERLPVKDQSVVKAVPFGLIQISEINAMCYRTLVGDIIIASEALQHYFQFISIFLFGDNFGISLEDRVAAGHIGVRLALGSETLDFDIDPRGELPAKARAVIGGHVETMMEFAFGHEFSHLTLGHLDLPSPSPETEIDVRKYSHALEFEADLHAVNAVIGKAPRSKLFFAALHVFSQIHFLEKFQQLQSIGHQLSVSTTHPTPTERSIALRLSSNGKNYSKPVFEPPLNLYLDQAAEFLSETVTNSGREDFLSFKGSVYMGGLGGKVRRDRFDF